MKNYPKNNAQKDAHFQLEKRTGYHHRQTIK